MISILIKALGFIFIIAIGFTLKQKGIFKKEHGAFLSTVIMNITLPCALLSSINNLQITPLLFFALVCGFLANVICVILGYYTHKKSSPMYKALAMINCSGYNIGTFTLPFVQSFFPGAMISYVCMFDTGNALMCLGGTYSAASNVVSNEEKQSVGLLAKKLFSSIPFCTYIILFFLSLFHIAVPSQILSMTSIAGNANAFLAMLMIGIVLEIKLDFSQLQMIKKILFTRYTCSCVLSLGIYFLLPIDMLVKKMIILALFSPISAVAPVFSRKIGSDSPVPAAVNSLSILISVCCLVILILLFA